MIPYGTTTPGALLYSARQGSIFYEQFIDLAKAEIKSL